MIEETADARAHADRSGFTIPRKERLTITSKNEYSDQYTNSYPPFFTRSNPAAPSTLTTPS